MKRICLLIFIMACLPVFSTGQTNNVPVTYLSDTLIPYDFEENWLFTTDDDSSFAQVNYDDSKWKLIGDPGLTTNVTKKKYYVFGGKGWMRLHINIDSNLNRKSLSLNIKHYGASEVYIDGRRLMKYGIVGDKETSEYFNPNGVPLIASLPAGPHVIAVRYANYNALWNYKVYNEETAGFKMYISKANYEIQNYNANTLASVSLTVFMFAFFFAFFLLHLFLFLYNKKEKANLHFSIFCLSFGLIFLAPYLRTTIANPIAGLGVYHLLIVCAAATCMSLSGFLNELFGSRKLRFTIIAFLSLLSVVTWFFYHKLGAIVCFLVVGIVCVEAIVLILKAIFKGTKGAIIVGIGILFLTFSLLAVIVFAVYTNSDVNMSGVWGAALIIAILSIPASMSIYLSWNYSSINKNLAVQLKQVETLSEKTLEQELEKQRLLENRQEELENEVELRTFEIKKEKQKSDDLLRNILPEEIAEELKQTGSSEAKYFDHVSVLFTDFVNFTKAGERMTPQELVDELHTCFKAFDEICSKYDIEKIKTIGDAYLAVCGLPLIDANHAINTTRAAIEIREFIAARTQQLPDKTFHIRIGIHSGAVVAGIVGVKKFAYDIWGDTVNTAARMEQHGESGKINVSQNTYELIKDQFNCTFRGQITAKNKGELNMYFVDGEK